MKDISLVKILPMEPKVPFINLRVIAAILSVIALIASVFLFSTRGLNYGIDFTGGTVIELDFGQETDLELVRTAVGDMGFDGLVRIMSLFVLVFHSSLKQRKQERKPNRSPLEQSRQD